MRPQSTLFVTENLLPGLATSIALHDAVKYRLFVIQSQTVTLGIGNTVLEKSSRLTIVSPESPKTLL